MKHRKKLFASARSKHDTIKKEGGREMSITVNLYYTGKDGSAKAFVNEMIESGGRGGDPQRRRQ